MASTSLNEVNLEKRLQTVSNTQESIQSLSLWCLHHKSHFKKIIDIWLKVLKKAKVSHRLALFYLANDVIQNSRRKGCPQFSEAWQPMIKQAVPYVSDEKIRIQIERILSIWEDRNVYDAAFIGDMHKVIASNQPKQTEQVAAEAKLLADFKPQKLADKIRKYRKLEADIDAKQKQFSGLKMDVCNTETLKQLKDKAHGTKFSKDFEDATNKLDEFVTVMQKSVKDRAAVIEMLEQSEAFYEVQKKEAKIVANAYKNFGNRVKNLHAKLKDYLPNLASPVPSPNADAPSPLDSSDGEVTKSPVALTVETTAATTSSSNSTTGTTTTTTTTAATVTPSTTKGADAPKAENNAHKEATGDNTEAVDMEMSDEDSSHAAHSNKGATPTVTADVASPCGSAPSPEGSPIGLNMSPAAPSVAASPSAVTVHPSSSHSKSPVSASPAHSIGKISGTHRASPVVTKASTASSIFASLTKPSSITNSTSNSGSNNNCLSNSTTLSAGQSLRNSNSINNASSLDIRLSNLLQNVPNFTSSFFGGRAPLDTIAASGNTPDKSSPTTGGVTSARTDSKAEEGGTPLKDEESGTGSATPLQDESRPGAGGRANAGLAGSGVASTVATVPVVSETDIGGNERNAWKLVVPAATPVVVVSSAANNNNNNAMHSVSGYGSNDNGGGDAFYGAPAWSADLEPTSTSNNIVDILQKLAAGTAIKSAPVMPLASSGGWIPVSPAAPDILNQQQQQSTSPLPTPPVANRPWSYDGFSPPPQAPLTGNYDPLAASYPYDPEIQFPAELDDIRLPDEMPPPDFEPPAPPQLACNSRNLITIAVQSAAGQPEPVKRHPMMPPLMGIGATLQRKLSGEANNHHHPANHHHHLHGNGQLNEPTGGISDDDEELYSRIETLDSRREQPGQPPSPDMGGPWSVSSPLGPPHSLPPHYQQQNQPTSGPPLSTSAPPGWHQIFPTSGVQSPHQPLPDQRRDQQQQQHHYGGFGFRFPPRGGGALRHEWPRDGGNGGHNAKRPPPPMMPMRPNRWPHSQRRPY